MAWGYVEVTRPASDDVATRGHPQSHSHILAIALLQLPMLVYLGYTSARKLLAGWRRLWLAGWIVEQGDDDTSKRERWNEAEKLDILIQWLSSALSIGWWLCLCRDRGTQFRFHVFVQLKLNLNDAVAREATHYSNAKRTIRQHLKCPIRVKPSTATTENRLKVMKGH